MALDAPLPDHALSQTRPRSHGGSRPIGGSPSVCTFSKSSCAWRPQEGGVLRHACEGQSAQRGSPHTSAGLVRRQSPPLATARDCRGIAGHMVLALGALWAATGQVKLARGSASGPAGRVRSHCSSQPKGLNVAAGRKQRDAAIRSARKATTTSESTCSSREHLSPCGVCYAQASLPNAPPKLVTPHTPSCRHRP